MRRFLVLLAPIMLLLVTACGTTGSGNLVTVDRPAGEFSAIRIGDALDLRLTVDPAADPAINVTFDDNLIDIIATRISGETLVIESTGSYNVSGGGRFIDVTMPTLTGLQADGASDVSAVGNTPSLEIVVGGASDVDLAELIVADLVLDVSGASDVTVHATTSVEGVVSGASDVLIFGNPTSVGVVSEGASNVEGR